MRLLKLTLMSCVLFGSAELSAREFSPVDPEANYTPSKTEGFRINAILQSMGLSYPDERKTPPAPSPSPAPQPQPKPSPKPAPSSDEFWGDDDDFFDDDRGFDEIVSDMDAEFDRTVEAWDREYDETVARWDKARGEYLKREKQLRSAVPPANALQSQASSPNPSFKNADIGQMSAGDFFVLPGAIDIPVRDQRDRGTCASFTGVRAIESILAQHGVPADFSEQHFYFLAKPGCQKAPCNESQAGSDLVTGLEGTRQASVALLPEGNCPYNPVKQSSNITYTPLNDCRPPGAARAGKYYDVGRRQDVIVAALRANRPVLAGYKLTYSYFRNKGLVSVSDPINAQQAAGEHVGGHANLLVGYIKLPESLKREGSYCVIAANSWGDGWGRGGYACLTERWLNDNLIGVAVLDSVTLTPEGMAYLGVN